MAQEWLAEVWGLRPDGTNPCRHVPMYLPGKETRLIVDEELVRIFRHLEHLEAEGLENYVIPLAIRLQFEFAARRSEICPLEWGWVDLEKRRVVWPDSKTGGISKPMSEEAYRLLSTAPRREGCRTPRRHAWHPPPGDHRYCQFGRANQGGHEAHRPQDVAMFMHYVHTEDKPVRAAAELVANRRLAITGASRYMEVTA